MVRGSGQGYVLEVGLEVGSWSGLRLRVMC